MLIHLTIQNVVLIEHLSLEGAEGLCALTGETGAGKSILLDALGLALGARADSKLVRHGTDQANITACFSLPHKHSAFTLLQERDIEVSEELILRRTVNKDGRSKAFVNDMPVSIQTLKDLGAHLIEIHGQFDTQGLMNPETHLSVVDSYARLTKATSALKATYTAWKSAQETLAQAKADIETSRMQEDYLRYAVKELEELSPTEGEEEALAEKRKRLMNQEKTAEAFEHVSELLESDQGVLSLFGKIQSLIEKTGMTPLIETTERAKSELTELSYQIEGAKSGDTEEENLEEIENRYFALKDCARKHHCTVDELAQTYEDLSQKLKLITHQEDTLHELEADVARHKKNFIAQAKTLSDKRHSVAVKLQNAVNKELPDLKLGKASFAVQIETLENEAQWNASGFDKIRFVVSTNPNTPAGPIHKIASGGELSRFMLALKVVLTETGTVPTLIFDEVDSGIGGATADAVGEKLAQLSEHYQVLVVTHSPQVASRANNHWTVSKQEDKGSVITSITPLTTTHERREEIARMLSGAEITAEARAAAAKLLEKLNLNAA